ncbi:tRNA (guanine-N(7)-)-methyltransferase non-catalytic subunit trm82, partial [Hyalella azteca]|uniref:tRNA (guanine-N(7)-)-methyltransferase non-catalytic subunit n=1 Tax=Hyalella azteca TaxID=294128 RepID=A0A8B7NQ04_HYAAZ
SENTASKCVPEEALEKEIVTGCCISSCEQFLAAITSHKKLLVWQAVNSSWQLQRSWSLIKRPVDLIFDSSSDHVLVADKTGDVLQFSLADASSKDISSANKSSSNEEFEECSPAPVILGHLSMLLSISMSHCGRYVATGDRDEKIRVSHYPRAHNIASFCLGHSEFVGQLRPMPSHAHLLLSASGDGTIRLWNLDDGKELSMIDTHEHSQSLMVVSKITKSDDAAKSASSPKSPSTSSASHQQERTGSLGRGRVIPKQCAVVDVAVTRDTGSESVDIVAAVFDRSRALALYSVEENLQLKFRCCVEMPRPAVSVTWISHDTLAAVCPLPVQDDSSESVAHDVSSPLPVWQLEGEQLRRLPHHALSVFADKHRQHFVDLYAMDAGVLYKQRYDNVAEYEKKKQERIQRQQENKKLCNELDLKGPSKRFRASGSGEAAS